MADQLATPSDLASALQQDVDTATATLWIECATAIVQAAAGQRIVQVVGDTITLTGTTSSWLDLPEIPVTAVNSVTLDGVLLTVGTAGSGRATYRVHGNRLWRADGWQTYNALNPSATAWWNSGEPSRVDVNCDHGLATGVQELQFARSATISLARSGYTNVSGVSSEKIDDYSVAYAAVEAQMTTHLEAALRRQYGRRAGLVRIG